MFCLLFSCCFLVYSAGLLEYITFRLLSLTFLEYHESGLFCSSFLRSWLKSVYRINGIVGYLIYRNCRFLYNSFIWFIFSLPSGFMYALITIISLFSVLILIIWVFLLFSSGNGDVGLSCCAAIIMAHPFLCSSSLWKIV